MGGVRVQGGRGGACCASTPCPERRRASWRCGASRGRRPGPRANSSSPALPTRQPVSLQSAVGNPPASRQLGSRQPPAGAGRRAGGRAGFRPVQALLFARVGGRAGGPAGRADSREPLSQNSVMMARSGGLVHTHRNSSTLGWRKFIISAASRCTSAATSCPSARRRQRSRQRARQRVSAQSAQPPAQPSAPSARAAGSCPTGLGR